MATSSIQDSSPQSLLQALQAQSANPQESAKQAPTQGEKASSGADAEGDSPAFDVQLMSLAASGQAQALAQAQAQSQAQGQAQAQPQPSPSAPAGQGATAGEPARAPGASTLSGSEAMARALGAQADGKLQALARKDVAAKAADGGSGSSGEPMAPDYALRQQLTRDLRSPMMEPGTRPWSKDWVFEGGGEQNPALRPLFGKSALEEMGEARGAQLAALMAAAQAGRAPGAAPAAGASPMPGQARPQAQPGQARPVGAAAAASGAEPANLLARQASPQAQMMASPAAGPIGSLAELAAQLQALDGEVTDSSGAAQPASQRAPGSARAQGAGGPQARAFQNGISGSEFLDTLSSVREPAGQAGATGLEAAAVSGALPRSSARPDLRVLPGQGDDLRAEQRRTLEEAYVPAGTNAVAPWQDRGSAPAREIVGHVVPGAMATNRLSHESLTNMTSTIQSLSAQGGGEMRIRLNPDSLGELRVQISSRGNSVGIQFVASNDKARKVLEDSVGYLRESLGSHNLRLTHVDFAIASDPAQLQGQARSQADQQGGNPNHSHQQGAMQGWMSQQQDASQGRGGGARWDDEDGAGNGGNGRIRGGARALGAAQAASAARASGAAAGRLDVMA